MMKRLAKGLTISRRLTFMNMLVSGAAVLLVCAVFLAYDLFTSRERIVNSLSIEAQIIGSNSVTALLFNDPDSAKKTLSALKASPNIVFAMITTPDGETFATYQREPGPIPALPVIPTGKSEVHSFTSSDVELARSIVFDGKPTSIVYIRSDRREIHERLIRYLWMLSGVNLLSFLAALFVSFLSSRAISEPIVRLAETASLVSRERNYSVRVAPARREDEISVLINGFNEMLSQIEERDEALRKAHHDLEARVQERTVQLAAANKELEAFSYSVSHDLRAPLRHIDGFSTILADRYGDKLDPTAQRYIGVIREGAMKMGELIDDLLKMGRVTRQEVVASATDMNLLVKSTMEDLQPEMQGREIEWRVGQLPTLNCDPNLMKVVLTNLLSNAVKYTGRVERPVIEVGQTGNDQAPVIFIRDNGAGFEQQYSHKLFGVFQRLHRSEEFEGTGVGLATVQRIIHRHGGQIWAESEVNKGATFFFTLAPDGRKEPLRSDPDSVYAGASS